MSKEMRDFDLILRRNGYSLIRSKGSHFVYLNETLNKHISINKDLNRMVKKRLIKENCLVV